MLSDAPFLRTVSLARERITAPEVFPFSLPAVRALNDLPLGAVTFFVGENGSGKSTILEAVAIASGFNPEGGTVNFNFVTRPTESVLHSALRLSRVARPQAGFFLRAETLYNLATEIERLGVDGYGDTSLHELSHGEAVLTLIKNRFRPHGLYILDEPEAALSPSAQLGLLLLIRALVEQGSQFIVATHAPIVLAYPKAYIYLLDAKGLRKACYDELPSVSLIRDFISDRERFLTQLFSRDASAAL